MKPRVFEARARMLWREIPEEYRAGVDGLVVSSAALPDPLHAEVYTLGECRTESYPSDFGGPETVRSVVVLYYGSFLRLSTRDSGFDWEAELWETLTHELRHHLEWLADEAALDAADHAAEQHFRRLDGQPFDPLYHRYGMEVAPRVFRVDEDFFLERQYRAGALEPGGSVDFHWHGERFRAPLPERLGDVCFLEMSGVDAGPGTLTLVLVRRHGWLDTLRALLRRRAADVVSAEAHARAVDERDEPA